MGVLSGGAVKMSSEAAREMGRRKLRNTKLPAMQAKMKQIISLL